MPWFFKDKNFRISVLINLFLSFILISSAIGIQTILKNSHQAQPVFIKGDQTIPAVSISFTISQGEAYLDDILEILALYRAKASFFVDVNWAKSHTNWIRRFDEAGHDIQILCVELQDLQLPEASKYKDLLLGEKLFKKMINQDPKLFAVMKGKINPQLQDIVASSGHQLVLYTQSSLTQSFETIIKSIAYGDILWLKPSEQCTKALPKLLDALSKSSLNIVTVLDQVKTVQQFS